MCSSNNRTVCDLGEGAGVGRDSGGLGSSGVGSLAREGGSYKRCLREGGAGTLASHPASAAPQGLSPLCPERREPVSRGEAAKGRSPNP